MFEYDAEAKKLLHGHQLYVPIAFLRNVKMRRGDHFDIKMENEKTMLLIPKNKRMKSQMSCLIHLKQGEKQLRLIKEKKWNQKYAEY